MGLIPRDLLRDRLFWAGLVLRLAALVLLVPQTQMEWFTPFMVQTLQTWSVDPWTSFLQSGGTALAFPYGPVMIAAHAPTVAIGVLVDRLVGHGLAFARLGFGVSLLLADFGLLLALRKLTHAAARPLVLAYWWSPIVLFVTYWHGQTDIVPTVLLVLGLLALQRMRLQTSAVLTGLSIAAKLSMGIAAPFLVLFVWHIRGLRARAFGYAATIAGVAAVLQVPFFFRLGARTMVLDSPEIGKLYDVGITLSNGTQIYLVPLIYLMLLFTAHRIGRLNFDLLFIFLGLSFLTVLLCTPASIGWYMWVVPFIAVWQTGASRSQRLLGLLFSLMFVGVKVLVGTGPAIPLLGLDFQTPLAATHPALVTLGLLSKGLTVLTAIGLALAYSMLTRGFLKNDFYRLSRRPVAIGIAGDSGTGKDTLSLSLARMFGVASAVSVSGDDYHLYERKGALWQTMTHLDPRANDLRAFTRDVLTLLDGKPIVARHYDHVSGRFTRRRQVGANEVVLVSGLHALYPLALREALDVSVFLDMDERLRQHFKLRRDVAVRGHALPAVLASIERRRLDFNAYVAPQAETADLCLALIPAEAEFTPDPTRDAPVPLRLRVRLRHALHTEELARALVGICGAGVTLSAAGPGGAAEMMIDGDDVCAEDLAFVGSWLVPHLDQLNPLTPVWDGGVTGIMQLCILAQLGSNARRG